jgi:hypothetical protein
LFSEIQDYLPLDGEQSFPRFYVDWYRITLQVFLFMLSDSFYGDVFEGLK